MGELGIRLLVAYASKGGSTKEIAEFIGTKLSEKNIETEVKNVNQVENIESYDAFVIGSAVYYFHWLKDARRFVSANHSILIAKPVWLFSSGPTGRSETDKKGRNLREVSAPKEMNEIRESINPRDHHVFFGAFFADRVKGAAGLFSRWIPEEEQGDFRDWDEIADWANGIADALVTEAGTGSSTQL